MNNKFVTVQTFGGRQDVEITEGQQFIRVYVGREVFHVRLEGGRLQEIYLGGGSPIQRTETNTHPVNSETNIILESAGWKT